ncbi:PREDICTED: GPI mannosyltransferase 2 isoform X2 [Lupinus angustifolius]|uniref:GPI mannosyltransferase 2 isoform X2 n=1 Tax=Lupinus angustifolius TaxID=3871 RepID=UPI00092EEE08|nr:PREDICTED: GPI mannosyltransferase 2 isoform X2 [Lupinus angustifolius]
MVQTSNPPHDHENQALVLKSATISRLIVLTLTIIYRILVSPYDTSAPLNPPCLTPNNINNNNNNNNNNTLPISPRVASAIENGVVWDSVYFVRIAQCGYEYEQIYAFLPLLPISISFFSRTVFAVFVPFIGHRAVLALSGYVINNLAFVFAALYFYKLSTIILKDHGIALQATILFCFNPASIFYSSIYSESLYSLLSFGGMYYFVSGGSNLSVIFLALSGCARSNGVLNAGYLCFQTMHQAYDAMFQRKRVIIVIAGAIRSAFIFAPFIAFQAYGYYNMCVGRSPVELRPWCKAKVPLLYNYIQSHYWDVGFLRYFQVKQLPNFLLATPILSLALCSVVHYAKLRPQIFFSLGFQTSTEEKSCGVVFLSDDLSRSKVAGTVEKSSVRVEENFHLTRRKKLMKGDKVEIPIESEPAARPGYLSASVLPFVLHLGFMAGTAFFVMHVQVATRFLSASPPIYWFASYMMRHHAKCFRWGYMIWAYSALYIFLGSLLFSNFYPFT